jgi:hypothetical protein
MSTLKSDAITAVTNDTDVVITGAGTGGVAINTHLKLAKGGDISSASPLVIDTDGTMFDVTGTTNFSAMTVEANRFFMLQFDGALTITHGSGIELPGASNLTTATGDRLICYATVANTVAVMSVELETDNTAKLNVAQAWTASQKSTVTALTSSSNSIAISMLTTNDYSHTFTENTTLANPSDTLVAGQSGSIFLTQAAGANYTLAFGSEYDFVGGTAPTVTATNAARDRLDYVVRADAKIEITALLNLS